MRDNSDLDQGAGGGGREKCSESGYILRVDLIGLADGLITGYKRKESRMISRFLP